MNSGMNFPQRFPRLFQNLEAWLKHLRFCCLMYQGFKKTCFPLQLPEASKAQAVHTGFFSVLLLLILFPFYHGGNWGLVVKQLSPGIWVLSSRRRIPWALGQVSHLFPVQHLPGNSPGFDTCCWVSFTLPKTCSLPVSDFIWRLIINPSGLFPLCQVQTKRSWQAPMINGIYVTNSTVPQQETAIDRLGVYLAEAWAKVSSSLSAQNCRARRGWWCGCEAGFSVWKPGLWLPSPQQLWGKVHF